MTKQATPDGSAPPEKPVCFVIMPISDQQGYEKGHFREVYEDIIIPAVEATGYKPVRADDVHAANLIHLDILGKILDAPLAICDMSAVNPNVMFELGIRQAFDKPVILIKDNITRDIFDISPIRFVSYDSALSHRGVKKAIEAIIKAIEATNSAPGGENVNSIVKLLGLRAAALGVSDADPESARMQLLEKALAEISVEIKQIRSTQSRNNTVSSADEEVVQSIVDQIRAAENSTAKKAIGIIYGAKDNNNPRRLKLSELVTATLKDDQNKK